MTKIEVMKYIPADKLIAEIERQMNECIGRFGVIHKLPEYRCLKNIHSYVTSLQQEQPEVDLKIEIGHWLDKLDDKYCMLVEDYSIQDIKDTARHFYELGKNTKKED